MFRVKQSTHIGLLNPEAGVTSLRNVGNYLPADTA
jgi:hypothetical protein